MARKFRPNPARQAILVALALVGLGIGYGAGYLFKPKSAPQPEVPSASQSSAPSAVGALPANEPVAKDGAAEPMMPEGNNGPTDAPHRAYEESLPKDILDNGALPPLHVVGIDETLKRPAEPDVEATTGDASAKTGLEGVPPKPVDEAVEWADSEKTRVEEPTTEEQPAPPVETAALPPAPEPAATQPPPAQVSPAEPKPAVPEDLPAWRKFAVAVTPSDGPVVAIVIDDMGVDRGRTRRA